MYTQNNRAQSEKEAPERGFLSRWFRGSDAKRSRKQKLALPVKHFCTLGATAVLIISILLLALAPRAHSAVSADEWWDSNYQYRHKVSVTAGSVNVPTEYSVQIEFDHAALVAAGKSLSSGDDIRIAYWNGSTWTELDRLLDDQSSWNSATTQVWFRTQAGINADERVDDYYMYYGYGSAGSPPTTWSNVFLFYDDFNDGSLDAGRWTCSGTCTESGGNLDLGTWSNLFATASYALGNDTRWETRVQLGSDGSEEWFNYCAAAENNSWSGDWIAFWTDSTTHYLETSNNSTKTNNTYVPDTPTSFHVYSFTWEGTSRVGFYQDGTEVEENTTNLPNENLRFLAHNDTGFTQVHDWVRVRKYVSPEPTHFIGGEEGYNAIFSYKKSITIDYTQLGASCGSDLTNFPFMINIQNDGDLKSTTNGGHVTNSNGYDIIFRASDGITQLDHEVEEYNGTNGTLIAWVRIPTLSSSNDTTIYLHYGNSNITSPTENPAGVWDSNYALVWHLKETVADEGNQTDVHIDSTANNNDGDQHGNDDLAGKIGTGQDFDTVDDYIEGTSNAFNTQAGTIDFWIQPNWNGNDNLEHALYIHQETDWDTNAIWIKKENDNTLRFWVADDSATDYRLKYTDISGWLAEEWHHITVSWDPSLTLKMYLDGSEITPSSYDQGTPGLPTALGSTFTLGGYSGVGGELDGTLDEVRISTVARDACQIETEHKNQDSPSTFYTVGGEQDLNKFTYRKEITFDYTQVGLSCGSDLTDFSVLIKIDNDSDLKTTAHGGYVQNSNGYDIIFRASDAVTQLDHEMEKYDGNTGTLVAWVRIPVLSVSTDTTIYMYYGNSTITSPTENPGGVWDENYVGVWHLNEEQAGTGTVDLYQDSTANANHGDDYVSATGQGGRIAGGQQFDGVDDFIDAGSSAILDDLGPMTISLWINPASFGAGYSSILSKDTSGVNGGWFLELDNTAPEADAFEFNKEYDTTDLRRVTSNGVVTYSDWQYLVLTWDGSDLGAGLHIYKDGAELTPYAITGDGTVVRNSDAVASFLIGNHGDGGTAYSGLIDEVRVSSVARSQCWIETEHSNQNTPSIFYSVGGQENLEAYAYRKEITIDFNRVGSNCGSDLYDFPVLVSITGDNDLKTAPTGHVESTDGYDIIFKDSDGNQLDHEVERYDGSAGTLVAWVRIPVLSQTSNTTFYIHYGNSHITSPTQNPGGVWDDNYVGVWHLKESGDGSVDEYRDSSRYANHGQGGEGDALFVPTQTGGKIGYGQDFNDLDGKWDLIDVGNHSSLDITGKQITLQAWVQYNNASHAFMGPLNHKGWSYGYRLLMAENSSNLQFQLPGDPDTLTSSTGLTTGSWHHLVATYDGSSMKIYIDGSKEVTERPKTDDILSVPPPENGVFIGHGDQPKDVAWSYEWEGQIDEVRISRVARSYCWIETEHNNQNWPNKAQDAVNGFLSAGTEQNLEDFTYRRRITINKDQVSSSCGSELSNFPVLIKIENDDELKTTTNGGHIESDSGHDIIFKAADDTTQLDHEIEQYSGTNGTLLAWVKIPVLSYTSNTNIYMYYGNNTITTPTQNPAGVWDSSYKGVWHMNEATGTTRLDSTANNNDLTDYNGVVLDTNGKSAGAADFDRTLSQSLEIADAAQTGLDITGPITVEAWVNVGETSNDPYSILFKWRGSCSLGPPYYLRATGGDVGYVRENFAVTDDCLNSENGISGSTTSMQAGNWYHLVGVYDGSNIRLYKNGGETNSAAHSTGIFDSDGNLQIGVRGTGQRFDGLIDEVRISSVARGLCWIETEFNNIETPSTFYTVESEQDLTTFSYRKPINIDKDEIGANCSADLPDFPVLVKIENDNDLKTAPTGHVESANGYDIVFRTSDGLTRLDHEVESYNGSAGTLIAWVRIPTLSSTSDTTIYMYYGNSTITSPTENPSGVWDTTTYKGVWHLNESSGDAQDSTSYGTSGAISGTVTQGSTGNIDYAYDFNTSGEVNCGDPADGHLDGGTGNLTVSLWVNTDANRGSWEQALYKGGSSEYGHGYALELHASQNTYNFIINDGSIQWGVAKGTSITLDTWHHIVAVVDRATDELRSYRDGVEQGTGVDISSIGNIDSTNGLTFSKDWGWMDGLLDEVHISAVARDLCWIQTEHSNQKPSSTFLTVGDEEGLNYAYHKPLTIYKDQFGSNCAADLSNFPVLIKIENNNDLKTAPTGHVESADGYDIIFRASDGSQLDHEIEFYDGTNGTLIAWVRIPTLSYISNTTIEMYYGNSDITSPTHNPNGVWGSNYAGVWHLKENGSGAADEFVDSTSNANHGQGGGGTPGYVPTRTGSHLGYGQTFDGTDDILAIGDPADGSLDMGTGSFSYSVWVNVTSSAGTWDMPWWKGGSSAGTTGYDMELGTGGWEALISDGSTNPNVSFGGEGEFLNDWVQLTAVVDRSTNVFRVYANGSYKGETSISGFGSVSNSGSATIGNDQNNSLNNRFSGIIDEVRVAKFAYDTCWIETEFSNQNDPSAFIGAGTEAGSEAPAENVTLANHTAGQEADKFDTGGSVTGAELFAFQLTNTTGSLVTVNQVQFQLSSVTGISDTDFANLEIQVDDNGDGTIDGSDTTGAVGGTGSVDGSVTTITFSTPFNISALSTVTYILRGDVNNLVASDTVTMDLGTGNITLASGTVGGTAPTSVAHTADASGDYDYRKAITVDSSMVGSSCSSALSDFPVLVKIGGPVTFSNTSAINIPDSGPGSVYPSDITVSGVTGTVTKVTVSIYDLDHTWADDIDMLLVGPGGQNVMLMSDQGYDDAISLNLTFDDDAASELPDESTASSGTYKPRTTTQDDDMDGFDPSLTWGTQLSDFNGVDPNGTWSLYIMDDAANDSGSLSGGWELTITTETVLKDNVTSASGDDIIFKAEDDTTCGGVGLAPCTLDHEIEKFEGSTGELVAWVRIPTLSNSADTTIYMYYGNSSVTSPTENPTAVWDSNFKMVQHLRETSGTLYDSTSNDNDGTRKGAGEPAFTSSGNIDGAQDFDGNTVDDDYIEVATNAWSASAGTVEAWVKTDGVTADGLSDYILGHTTQPSYANRIQIYLYDQNRALAIGLGDQHERHINIQNFAIGIWYHVVLAWDGTNYEVFVDGVSKANGSYSGLSSIHTSADIGNNGEPAARGESWNGIMDEFRVSNIARGACWIETEYNNQNSPTTFTGIGPEANPPDVNLANHVAGQEADKFDTGSSVTGAELFAFKLTNDTASPATVNQVQFQLSSVTGISDSDFANLEIYVDDNGDGTIDGSDTTGAVGGAGAVDGSVTTITFNTPFDLSASATVNYILTGDVNNLVGSDTVTIGLGTSDITLASGTVGGSSVSSVTHTSDAAAPNLTQIHYRWRNDDSPPWWNSSYLYRKKITVTAGSTEVPSGYSVSVTLDHAALYSAGKSLESGDDVRVVYWNGATWTELDRVVDPLSSWNNASTHIWFKSQAIINASSFDDNYYIYYGHLSASNPPDDWANVFMMGDDFNDGTLTAGVSTSTAGTASITETGGEAFIDLGTNEGTDAGIIVMANSLPSDNRFAIRHKTKLVSGGGASNPEFKGIGIGESAGSYAVDTNTNENPRRRIISFSRVDTNAQIYYFDGPGSAVHWNGAAWVAGNGFWGTLSLDTYYIHELISDGTDWYVCIRDANGTAITTTTPIPWASTYDTGDPFWFYWGEVYTNYYYADSKSDWVYVRTYIDPEPTSALGGEESEASGGASWAANEDTKLNGLSKETPIRLRLEVSNEGTVSSGGVTYQLQVAETATCGSGTYSAVPTDASGHWQIVDSSHITDGEASSNIDSGLTDEATTFVAGQLKDAGNTTGSITLGSDAFTEIEFSVQATTNATTGGDYCFRLYDTTGGSTLNTYSVYGEVSIAGGTTLTQAHYRWRNDDGGEGGFNTGTSADGSVTINSSRNINTHVLGSNRSTNADGITTTVSANPTGTSISVASTTGFAAGDEILLINIQGASGDTADVGNYEFLIVDSVPNGTTLNLTTPVQKSYDGSSFANQKIVVQRVPQWTDVTINGGSLTANAWNGTSGGIIVFRATGTVSVAATTSISADGLGYRGGTGGTSGASPTGGLNGESYDGSNGSGGNDGQPGTLGGGAGRNNTNSSGTTGNRGGGGGGGAEAGSDATNAGGGGGGGGYAAGGGGGGGSGDGGSSSGAGGFGGVCTDPDNPLTCDDAGGGGGAANNVAGGAGGDAGSPGVGNQACPDGSGVGGIAGTDATTGKGGGSGDGGVTCDADNGGAGGGGGGQYGDATLTQIFLGSGGGGGGGSNEATNNAPNGGAGGGIIFIIAHTVTVGGTVSANGANGTQGGPDDGSTTPGPYGASGGGAGGSIMIQAKTFTNNATCSATGGSRGAVGGTGSAGAGGGEGGIGRIRIEADSITGTTSPAASTLVTATWAANEDMKLNGLLKGAPIRLRFEVSNEGTASSGPVTYKLQVAETSNCGSGTYTDVPTVSTGHWQIVDSSYINDGEATSNIDLGLTDEATTFAPGELKDAGNTTGSITLAADSFTEIEFSIQATSNATDGGDYCFRLYDTTGGSTLDAYTVYAQVSIAAPSLDQIHYRWRNDDGGEGGFNTGTGADGSVTINSSQNINTDVLGSNRSTNADGILTTVSANPTGTSISVASTTGFAAGDEILLINMQGASGDTADVGNYEFLILDSVPNGTTLNLTAAVQKSYDGSSLANQKIVVQRVPQWTDVTIQSGGTLTANAWDGTSGGIIVFRATSTVDIQSSGTISANALGYRAGNGVTGSNIDGYQAESYAGAGAQLPTNNVGAGGGGDITNETGDACGEGGGGGGYGSAGTDGGYGTSCAGTLPQNNAGATYGVTDLSKIYVGSGGGGGGNDEHSGGASAAGARGAGIVMVFANTITVNGGLRANGADAPTTPADGDNGMGGGGSGGSIYLAANSVTLAGGSTTASGGAGGPNSGNTAWVGAGGDGGVGRIRIEADSITGTTSPAASTLVTASWAADQDNTLTGVAQGTIYRVRFEVSNEGTASSGAVTYRLQVAETSNCGSGTYVDVPTDTSGHWQIVDSSYITDGENSFDNPGLTNEGTTWVDGQLKDTGNTTGSITLNVGEFTEIEFSVQATSNAIEGADYCFRLYATSGASVDNYTVYAQVTMAAPDLDQIHYRWRNEDGYEKDGVRIGTPRSAIIAGTDTLDITNVEISGSNRYLLVGLCYNNDNFETTNSVVLDPGGAAQTSLTHLDGAFAVADDPADDDGRCELWGHLAPPTGTFTVRVTISGVTASNKYIIAGAWPLSGVNQSTPRGSVVTNAGLSNTPSVTVPSAIGETVFGTAFQEYGSIMQVQSPGEEDWERSSNDVAGGAHEDGDTSVVLDWSAELNDKWAAVGVAMKPAPEATAATFDIAEDTKLTGLAIHTVKRLRFLVSNEGDLTSGPVTYQLQVAETGDCGSGSYSAVPTDSSGHWQIVDSSYTTDGEQTFDNSGLTNEGSTWVDGQVKDAGNTTGSITLDVGEFVEIEFVLRATENAADGGDYCFRLYDTTGVETLDTYTVYAEVQLANGIFSYRKPITIPAASLGGSCGADLDNFPVLISLSDSDLASKAKSDGYDIIFRGLDDTVCGGAGTAPCHLDHEIEFYDGSASGGGQVTLSDGWYTGSGAYTVPAGTNRLLVFVTTLEEVDNYQTTITNVTFGGVSMTPAVQRSTYSNPQTWRSEIWYLKDADIPAGSNSFTVTYNPVPSSIRARHAYVLFTNVNQFNPFVSKESGVSTVDTVTTDNPLNVLEGGMAVSGAISGYAPGNYSDAGWGTGWNEGTDQDAGWFVAGTANSPVYGSNTTESGTATFVSGANRQVIASASLRPTSGGTLIAWVRLPKLSSSSDTTIYMYYGNPNVYQATENPAAVWSNGYEAVYHLHDDFNDSLGTHNGTNSGSTDVGGQIANGQDFYPTDGVDEVDIGNWSVSGNQLTIQAWIKSDDSFAQNDPRVISKATGTGTEEHVWMMSLTNVDAGEDDLRFRLKTGTDDATGTTTLLGAIPNATLPDGNSWYLVAMTYDGAQMRIIRDDGIDCGSVAKTGDLRENAWPISIGSHPGETSTTARSWDGKIDEVRISSIERDACWIGTEYKNQSDPGDIGYDGFYSVGVEEATPVTAVGLISFTAKGQEGSVLVAWETAQEIKNMGFNLYRAESPFGPFKKINDKLIPGLSYSVKGKAYSFMDSNVTRGQLYYYRLEDIDVYGKKTLHGPICVDWDTDRLPDDWEIAYGFNPLLNDSALDLDGDGLTNLEEYAHETDPFNPDSDGDGIPDGQESGKVDRGEAVETLTLTPGVQVLGSDDTGVTLELRTDIYEMEVVQVDEDVFQRLRVSDYIHGFTSEVGKPELPMKGVLLDLPDGVSATLRVEETESQTLEGFWIYPVPEKAVSGEEGAEHVAEFFAMDEAAYTSNVFYPAVVAELGQTYLFRDQHKLQIRFYPFAFNPETKELTHYTRIRVRVEYGAAQATTRSASRALALPVPSSPSSSPRALGWAPPSPNQIYKILVSEKGVYRMTGSWLASMGVDVTSMSLDQVRLYNLGQEVPIYVYDGGVAGQFDSRDYIEFYGGPVASQYRKYANHNVYWLTDSGVSGGLRMGTIDGSLSGTQVPPSTHTSTVRYEEEKQYEGSAPGADHLDRWFFDRFVTGADWPAIHPYYGGVGTDFDIHLPEVAGQGSLNITLFAPFDMDHEVEVSVNSTVRTLTWSGIGYYEGSIDSVDLVDGLNTVTLRCNVASDGIYADRFEVTYPRSFVANGDSLKFSYDAGSAYQIFGFSGSELLAFDITTATDVRQIISAQTTDMGGSYSLDMEPQYGTGERTYLVLSTTELKLPVEITQVVDPDLSNGANGADYILITHRDLGWDVNGDPYPWLNNLFDLRYGQGLRVQVVEVEDIYNEFSYGIVTPQAIKDFLSHAYDNWTRPAPQYVLLVGDSTYDYKDNLGLGTINYVPTYLSWTNYMGETLTDDWFARVSGNDAIPDLYIGRLPAADAAQAAAMVNKIVGYESTVNSKTWEKNTLLVSDDQTEDYEAIFEIMSNDAAALIPVGMSAPFKEYLEDYANAGALNLAIKNKINNEGALVVNYSGHGYLQGWAWDAIDEIFENADVASLSNSDKLPFFVSMTCLNGHFGYPETHASSVSLAEVLMRSVKKGAVAAFMSTGMTQPEGQRILDVALFEAIFKQDNRALGPAISAAKQTLLANGAEYEDVSKTFLLFGDPATKLKIPLPTVPAGLVAEVQGSSVVLSWQGATDANGGAVTGYNVYKGTTPGGPYTKVNTALITGTGFTDTSAQTGTFYYVVKSVDSDGDESVPSNELVVLAGARTVSTTSAAGGGGGGGGCFISSMWK